MSRNDICNALLLLCCSDSWSGLEETSWDVWFVSAAEVLKSVCRASGAELPHAETVELESHAVIYRDGRDVTCRARRAVWSSHICVNGWWCSASSDSVGGSHEMFSAGNTESLIFTWNILNIRLCFMSYCYMFHVLFPVFSHSLVRFSKRWRLGLEQINQPSLLDWHKPGAAIITRNENDLGRGHQTLPGEILRL